MEMPETRAAKAAEKLSELGKRKRRLLDDLADLEPQIREAGLAAAAAGIPVSRVIALAAISTRTYYQDWQPDKRKTAKGHRRARRGAGD